ncbi:hypothetical protein DVA86_25900 [Streptomyces armeniacus]|uniref:Protein kinase domain-containing protein n=1 Tax=Streptomyces armeniacus TaxID=83291 RepID=A0A345XV98_9ACTN|nr:serine/threonine-protein kinase [Streptomyces armeniacus]AXK35564.1 hypothetical protein DVA86_25900 [Streptomyces armeniacus]
MQPLRPDDPRRVGDHRLLARLGAGGMGTVYLARSPGARTVAVKVVREHFARDARYRARFRREVAAARTVTGTFTAALLDADPEAEVPWLATDYLPGLSLREAVGTFGALPADTTLLLAAALAEALADIHRAGLAHRDLKPANIVLTAGGPRVIDFGIARPEDATAITVPGALPGTPGFMSPEQASGGLAGPPGDVFALGAVLAYAATGRGPFDAGDRAATLERVRLARTDLAGLTDRGLRALVAACLRREPERRPTAAALLDRAAALRDRRHRRDRQDRQGEPAASVRGTRWLPAPLAEAVDRRAAAEPPGGDGPFGEAAGLPRPGGGLPGETTAEPGAVTAEPGAVTAGAHGPGRPPRLPGLRRPGRRTLLLAAAAVPVAAGASVVLGESVLSGSGRTARTTRTPRPGGGTGPPPEAGQRWKKKVVAAGYPDYPDLYAAGGVVLAAHSKESDVRALDPRTGEVLWSHPSETGPMDPVTAGPDGVYLVGQGGEQPTVIDARDPASGKIRWRYRLPFGFPWAGAATGPVFCLASGEEVTGLGAEDGRQRWTARATGMDLTAADGLVVAAGEGVLAGLDARSGRVRWRHEMGETPQQPVIGEGLVFARDTYGTLYAVGADDGKPVWRQSLHSQSSVRPAAGGLLLVDETDGRVRAVRAGTGKEVWARRFGRTEANPYGESYVLGRSGGTLWVGSTDRTVYALDAAGGRVLWTYGTDATYRSASASGSGALALGGLVFIASDGGHVEAVSPPGGTGGGSSGSTGGGSSGANGGSRGAT